MWFDVTAALAEIEGNAARVSEACPSANSANPANLVCREPVDSQNSQDSQPAQCGISKPSPSGPRPEDAETLATYIGENGPASYGAAGHALGWGMTRAWRAEAELRAAGHIRHDKAGRAALLPCGGSHDRR